MAYEKIKGLSAEEFRRLTGLKPDVFKQMAKVLQEAEWDRRLCGGPKRGFSVEDQLLTMLEYRYEHRTYFHIAQSRGISESSAWRIIRRCETALIKSGKFTLPGGRKALVKRNPVNEDIQPDETESPNKRSRKRRVVKLSKRKNGTR